MMAVGNVTASEAKGLATQVHDLVQGTLGAQPIFPSQVWALYTHTHTHTYSHTAAPLMAYSNHARYKHVCPCLLGMGCQSTALCVCVCGCVCVCVCVQVRDLRAVQLPQGYTTLLEEPGSDPANINSAISIVYQVCTSETCNAHQAPQCVILAHEHLSILVRACLQAYVGRLCRMHEQAQVAHLPCFTPTL